MWRKVLKLAIQFLSNHFVILIILAITLVFFLIGRAFWIYDEYNGNWQKYKLDKLNLRQEKALAKLEGKKPCRILKIRKRLLKWKLKHLKNSLHIVNIKLDNTQEILDKYSYE